MQTFKIKLVLISGPVGVGKTSVAEELSGMLERANIGHTFVDLDGLAKTYPRPRGDKFGQGIALKNLSAVWTNACDLGVRNLIIARVVETREGARQIEYAVGAEESVVVQLMASNATLISRVRQREIGSGRAWHERRALELSEQLKRSNLADINIDTDDRSVEAIALELQHTIEWV